METCFIQFAIIDAKRYNVSLVLITIETSLSPGYGLGTLTIISNRASEVNYFAL
jgi:hypothetical protein